MGKSNSLKIESRRNIPIYHPEEVATLSAFIQATEISDSQLDECENRGLLPIPLAESFVMLKFLSRTILAAQKAQRQYGVPASVLIGIAVFESSWDADDLIEGRKPLAPLSPEIERWFSAKAKCFAESPQFSDAWPLVNDGKAYVEKLYSLGFGKEGDVSDVLSIIERFGLEECDLAGILRPGDYSKERYIAVRDEAGVMQLKPFDLRELIAMRRTVQVA